MISGRLFEPSAFPTIWPYSAEDFVRADGGDDRAFYEQPRFASHIHTPCSEALTAYYRGALPPRCDLLDLCSSWTSHLPSREEVQLINQMANQLIHQLIDQLINRLLSELEECRPGQQQQHPCSKLRSSGSYPAATPMGVIR